MGKYTLVVTDTGNDIGTLTGQTLSLGVLSGSGPKGDGWTGVTFDNSTNVFTFTSNDGLGYVTDPVSVDIAGDTTPQLGGDLDLNGNDITGTGNLDITGNITATGYLRGPATFTIDPAAHGDDTGTVVIAGNLQVDGTTTTINSTTLTVDDLNITVASGAANAAAADGAGITVDGASASITYDATGDEWQINKPLDVTGAVTATSFASSGDMTFGDNDKAIFGAGSDLQIYSDGTTSFIKEGGAGNFAIDGTNIFVRNGAGTANMASFVDGGAASLYHNSTARLATTSTGVDITGTLTSDGLTVDGDISLNDTGPKLNFFETDTTDVNTRLRQAGGGLFIETLNDANTVATSRLKIDNATGDISFYEDTGTTPKFFWDASAESLGIGTSSPQEHLHVSGTGTQRLEVETTQVANSAILKLTSTAGSYGVISDGSDALTFYDYGSSVERMRIDSSGNVGIGTSSPSALLTVKSSGQAGEVRMDSDGGAGRISSNGDLQFYTNNSAYSIQFKAPNDGAEHMRIDSSGNVGIGTSDPSDLAGGSNLLLIKRTDTANNYPTVYSASAGNAGWRMKNNDGDYVIMANDALRFYDIENSTERMRIDSSGHLLVGNTSFSNIIGGSGGGIALQGNGTGTLWASRTNDITGVFNRLSTDGNIVEFRKDGTTVGSIGSSTSIAGNFYIAGSASAGLQFRSDDILPTNGAGSYTNGAVDLGDAGAKFRHGYFSGAVTIENGIYLGGSAAANLMDDYETGTWTPTTTTSGYTIAASSGFYTKIGRLVTLHFEVNFSAVGANNNSLAILGQPFASVGNTIHQPGVGREASNTGAVYVCQVNETTNSIGANSMDGVSGGVNRTFRTAEKYVFTATYTTS